MNSRGATGFLLNEANLTIDAGLGTRAKATLSVNFTPRSGSEFALGDWFDLDLAQLEWRSGPELGLVRDGSGLVGMSVVLDGIPDLPAAGMLRRAGSLLRLGRLG